MNGSSLGDYGDVVALARPYHLAIEVVVAAVVVGGFFISSLLTLPKRFHDVDAWHIHLGAAITGVVAGIVIGFIIVPLRLAIVEGHFPKEATTWSFFGFFAITFALRRGLLGRLPFLGPQVRAYRRASLRRAIELSEKELAKLSKKRPQRRHAEADPAAEQPAASEAEP